jgi:uncharacterized protein (DUF433 family)
MEHIVRTPGTCGGKPRIAGTRIRVQDIVIWHEAWGWSPEEIITDYPQLTLAQVHAALAYYYDHREDIRQQMQAADALIAAFTQHHPAHVFELRSQDHQGANAHLPPG